MIRRHKRGGSRDGMAQLCVSPVGPALFFGLIALVDAFQQLEHVVVGDAPRRCRLTQLQVLHEAMRKIYWLQGILSEAPDATGDPLKLEFPIYSGYRRASSWKFVDVQQQPAQNQLLPAHSTDSSACSDDSGSPSPPIQEKRKSADKSVELHGFQYIDLPKYFEARKHKGKTDEAPENPLI
ncbi:unnamed protein product, partial [Mesorhabditis spiculigera]